MFSLILLSGGFWAWIFSPFALVALIVVITIIDNSKSKAREEAKREEFFKYHKKTIMLVERERIKRGDVPEYKSFAYRCYIENIDDKDKNNF